MTAKRAPLSCFGFAVAFFAGLALLPAAASNGPGLPEEAELTFSGSYLAARTASVERDADAAARFLGRALKSDPDNRDLLERTFLLRLASGDVDGALPLADRLIALKSENGLAKLALGIKALKDGSFAKARDLIRNSGRGPVAELTSGLLVAWSNQGLKNTDAALAQIDALSGPDWYGVFKNYHRGLIADLAGRTDTAKAALAAAQAAEGTGLRIVEAYARIMARSGDRTAADKALSDFAAQTDGHPAALRLRDEIRAGKPVQPPVRSSREGAAEALYLLAVALIGDNDNDLPAIYLELSLYLDPQHEPARLSLGDIRQAAGSHEKAIAAFGRVAPGSALAATAAIEASLSLDALDRTEEAITRLKAALAADPSDVAAAQALGDILRGRKRFAEAAEAYTTGVKAIGTPTPRQWRIFYSRGITLERTDRWDEAEADFRRALALNPEQPQVLNYLGYSLVDKGLKLDEAMQMIRKAVELRPEDGYIVDSLGWAHYKLGQYDDAVRELERALVLMAGDPVVNDHLGDAYWQTGRRLEATFQWSHARDLKPEPEDLARILKKLESGLVENAGNGN